MVRGELKVERDFKSIRGLARGIRKVVPGSDLVVIEQVHAMPGEGVVSCFSFGKSTGAALGVIDCCHEPPPLEIAPQKWQNYFKKRYNIPKEVPFKEVTQRIAEQVFPMYIEYFVRKKDHNTADAVLLAAYAAVHYPELYALREKLCGKDANWDKTMTLKPMPP